MQSDGNFGEFGPFLWDLWSFELERSASESPAFPYFLLLVQLKILNVHKTASKWLKKLRDCKKQNKNTRCHFYFYFLKKLNLERILFIFIHSLIYSKSQQTSTEFGLPEVPAAALCSKENGLCKKKHFTWMCP